MKKFYRNLLATLTFGLLTAAPLLAQSDLVLSGIYDGPLTGGTPKGVEIYVINDIADLSSYGLGSANNGGGTDGVEFTFPAIAVTAGTYIYVTTDSAQFNNFFGFDADFIDGSMTINGDDAVELFMNGTVVDVFGDINTDGTGQPWEYLDSWAYRTACTGPDDSTFTIASWSFGGPNSWDNETSNATSTVPMPIGSYTACTVLEVQFNSATASYSEGATTIIVQVNITNPDANPTSVDVVLDAGSSTATNGLDFNVTTPQTVTFPGGSSTPQTISFPVSDDAIVEGNESIIFDLMNPTNGAQIGSNATHNITIIDNDVPTVEFNGAAVTIDESAGTVDVTLNITNPAITATTVDVALGGASTATNGSDFTFTDPTTVTFPGGSTAAQTITIPVTDDMMTENDETIVLELTNVNNNGVFGIDSIYTITITDNDITIYDIADVTGMDANGVADSSGVYCGLRGVVYGVNMRTSGLQFTLIDPTDGIGVISFSNNFGYTVTEGDSIEVQGTVGQFNGLTQINIDTVILYTANNALKPAMVVTTLDEVSESDLVRINDVRLVDVNQWSGTGSGFNVDVTDGTNTYTVRIDAEVDLYSMPAPTGPFDVCGIGGQFDNSSPYDGGYQLLPRYNDDIKIKVELGPDTTACGSVVLDAEWANTTWSTGNSSQTITATASGQYIAISTYGSVSATDTINVTIVPAPTSAFTAPDTACATIAPVNFVDNSTGATSWNWDFGDGNSSTDQNPSHTYTGPGTWVVTLTVSNGTCTDVSTFNIFVQFCSAIEEFAGSEVQVFPTLAEDVVNVNLDLFNAQDVNVTLTDLSGRTVATQALGEVKTGTHRVSVEGLNTGLYLLTVEGEGMRSTFRVMVK